LTYSFETFSIPEKKWSPSAYKDVDVKRSYFSKETILDPHEEKQYYSLKQWIIMALSDKKLLAFSVGCI